MPEGVVLLDHGDGEEGEVGEDGPAESAELEGVGGTLSLIGAAAGDGEFSGSVEACVEGGGIEDMVVGEDELDGVAMAVGAVHGHSAGISHEPASDLHVLEPGGGSLDDDGLFSLFKKEESAGVVVWAFLEECLVPGGGPGVALDIAPHLFVDAFGEAAVAVDMVVVSDGVDAEVEGGDIFGGVDEPDGAGDLAVGRGEDPMMFCAVGVVFTERSGVRHGGECWGECELAGQDLIFAASGLATGDGEGVTLDDEAEGAVLTEGDAVGADANVGRVGGVGFGGVDVQELRDFFSALIYGEVGGGIMAGGQAGRQVREGALGAVAEALG